MTQMSWKQIVLRIVVLAGVVVVFSGCPEIFTGGLNSPLDPDAADYQGFDTVAHPDDMQPHIADGATMEWPRFVVSLVDGAESYHLQIATEQDFSSGSVIHDKADYPNHMMMLIGDVGFIGGTMYYWRSRARVSGGQPGSWTPVRSFVPRGVSGMSPGDGTSTPNVRPTLSWNAVEDAASYEVQIVVSVEGVSSATVIEREVSNYRFNSDLAIGDSRYWRVRAKDQNGVYGAWAETASFSVRRYEVGDTGPAGGIVFYDKGDDSGGWRYLEAWTSDEGTCRWKTIAYATNTYGGGIGRGYINTYTVLTGTQHPAAEVARNATHGGFNDWFLPSRDELNLMYQQREVIGGFAPVFYWSSTDAGTFWASGKSFGHDRHQYFDSSTAWNQVRLIRAFNTISG